jgi:hypothetical protein
MNRPRFQRCDRRSDLQRLSEVSAMTIVGSTFAELKKSEKNVFKMIQTNEQKLPNIRNCHVFISSIKLFQMQKYKKICLMSS